MSSDFQTEKVREANANASEKSNMKSKCQHVYPTKSLGKTSVQIVGLKSFFFFFFFGCENWVPKKRAASKQPTNRWKKMYASDPKLVMMMMMMMIFAQNHLNLCGGFNPPAAIFKMGLNLPHFNDGNPYGIGVDEFIPSHKKWVSFHCHVSLAGGFSPVEKY